MAADMCAEIGPVSSSSPSGRPRAGIVRDRLENGLDIVAIPDHRSPIVTHMIWYRNGSGDDPVGRSGIAHFLEHLMFKGTARHPAGMFSAQLADLGGNENAFTSRDYTAYYQRGPKRLLPACMAYEADRMKNLVLTDEVVAPERDVVLEERRMRVDADPAQILDEAMQAALFTTHPYGKPIIGWQNEIEGLGRRDAIDYYEQFYTPENAILVVAGDVEPATVRDLAEEYYGPIVPFGRPPERRRPKEPPQTTRRRVSLADGRVEQERFVRVHVVPSYTTAETGEAEALEVLAALLGGGETSLLTRTLVNRDHIAVFASAGYMGEARDASRFVIDAVPAAGVTLQELDKAIEAVVARLAREGFDDTDIARAKIRLVAESTFARDSQMSLANWYGASLATGMSEEALAEWCERIEAVTVENLRKVIGHLDIGRCVTGYLEKS